MSTGGTIAILGAGKMGEALIAGLVSSGWRPPDQIVAADRRAERLAEISGRFGVRTTESNTEAVAGAEIVVIAVKPQDMEVLLTEIGSLLTAGPDRAVDRRGDHDPGDRAPPRTSRCRSCAACPTLPPPSTRAWPGSAPARTPGRSTCASAEELLAHVGRTVRVPEPQLDAVTAVSGSGPAYFALLAESMIEAGILLGLPRETATDLVVQTMFGTAKLLRDEKMHPVELRESVTSPGGTTIAAIRELEQAGVRAAFLNAIQAAMNRSREIAAEAG